MTPERMARLTDVFRTIFNLPELDLRPELTAQDVPGWDSFNHITLVISIEEEFQTKFSTKEVRQLANVGDLFELLDKKLGS